MYSKTAGRDHEIAQWGTTLVVQSGFYGLNTIDPYGVRREPISASSSRASKHAI